jgi:hypothetical protein
MPGGDLAPYMSGRLRTRMIDALFEATGGFERAKAWIEANDENYKEFFKLYAKGAIRPTVIEATATEGLEDMLARLDAGEHAKVVEGEVVE